MPAFAYSSITAITDLSSATAEKLISVASSNHQEMQLPALKPPSIRNNNVPWMGPINAFNFKRLVGILVAQ